MRKLWVKNTVGHISLSFSAEDGDRIREDDGLMLKIAHDYMKLMGIENTQFIIAHAITEHLPLISSDTRFSFYRSQGLDLIFNEK